MKSIKTFSMLVILVVVACSKVDNAYNTAHIAHSPYTKSVAYYQGKAEASEGAVAQSFEIKAAGRMLEEGMDESAEQKLTNLQNLPTDLQDEKFLLEAKRYLVQKKAKSALKTLSKLSAKQALSNDLKVYYYKLLSAAFEAESKSLNALSARFELETLLTSGAEKEANQRAIWTLLSSIPLKTQTALMVDASEPLLGWLRLNELTRHYRDSPAELQKHLMVWEKENQGHQANYLLREKSGVLDEIIRPEQIALLLPLSGPLSGPGEALKDGFMASYYHAKSSHPRLRFYDTYQKDIATVYQEAVNEKADFVIGPLEKEKVKALSKLKLTVPVLSLNEIAGGAKMLYQFGLSSTDETSQVTRLAYDAGYRNALLIAPESAWGEPIAKKVSQDWAGLGGKLSDSLYYSKDTKMGEAIKLLLHIADSTARSASIKKILAKPVKFMPRRRQDFDVIFLVAYPSKARQIKPLLNYYYAGNIPIYSSSLVYAGKPNAHDDRDLNGVIFTEMPWVLNHSGKDSSQSWPEQFNSYSRLYAMGKDAYLLSFQLSQLLTYPALGLNNNTGRVFITQEGKVKRALNVARFTNGVPHLIKGRS